MDTLHEIYDVMPFKEECKHCLLTITLKPKLFKFQSITQYELTMPHLRDLLEKCGGIIAYVVTELTEVGNIHYHIVLSGKDKLSMVTVYNRIRKNRLFGFIHVKPILEQQGYERSIKYCTKELDITKKALSKPPHYIPDIALFIRE